MDEKKIMEEKIKNLTELLSVYKDAQKEGGTDRRAARNDVVENLNQMFPNFIGNFISSQWRVVM